MSRSSARRPLFVAFVLAMALSVPGATAQLPTSDVTAATLTIKPNIIVFYLDDVPAHDGRLWGDATLTPTLHDLFVAYGVTFSNAVGETPLCCLGRASLLTGQHTHNHGVVVNDARLFNPAEHVGQAMLDAGYASMWIGKYMNQNHRLTASDWLAHGRGWSHLDAIVSRGSGYYDYDLHTKEGTASYGRHHSSRMAAERTITRMRSTPSQTPIFAVVSLFDMHGPNYPMPEFNGDPRCDSMPPWNPPNYNEADVSDKPAYIRSLPLLPYADGWPMTRYCTEALGVDWAVEQVTSELESQGRLDNTLLVFTSDNGMGWGAHRIGQDKSLPYTTPLPLYMSWPGRWGSDPREITDVTSNIDLAPTFCALAGCTLGSYPAGQQRADGSSLLPLLDGEVASLARKSVLETNWESGKRWTAIRTGFNNRLLGPWHYVEHSTGEKELYDLTADPWELHNQANNSSLSSVQEALRQRLDRLRNEGVRAHVDATINVPAGTIKGAHLTSAVPLRSQTVTLLDVAPGTTREFVIRAWNRGGQPDRLTIQGETMGSSQISVAYRVGGVDVTASLINGTYTTALLDIQRNVELRVRMTVASAAPAGSRAESVVRVSSIAEPVKVDVVKAVAVH